MSQPDVGSAYQVALETRAGGCLSADDVGRLLGISRQAVDDRRTAGSLLAVHRGDEWAFPRAQFHEQGTISNLAAIVEGLEVSGPWATLEFLVTPDDTLGGLTPRDALLRGGEMRERVLVLVRGHREGEGYA